MTKFIAYTMDDNSIRMGIIHKEDGQLTSGIQSLIDSGLSEYEAIDITAKKGFPQTGADGVECISFRVADISELPKGEGIKYDAEFRGAFESDGSSISVNMEKARNIHLDRIKFARNEKLKVLDIETMKGVDVQPQKQVLRDLHDPIGS